VRFALSCDKQRRSLATGLFLVEVPTRCRCWSDHLSSCILNLQNPRPLFLAGGFYCIYVRSSRYANNANNASGNNADQRRKIERRGSRRNASGWGSSHLAIHPRESAISCKRTERLAGNQRVEPEAFSCIGDHEEALHENQEDVEPRPFLGLSEAARPTQAGGGLLKCSAACRHHAPPLASLPPLRRRRPTDRWHPGCNWRFHLGMVLYNVSIVLVQPSDGGERPVGRPTCHLRVALPLGRPIVHMKAALVGF
jgi:hypothetical protein